MGFTFLIVICACSSQLKPDGRDQKVVTAEFDNYSPVMADNPEDCAHQAGGCWAGRGKKLRPMETEAELEERLLHELEFRRRVQEAFEGKKQ